MFADIQRAAVPNADGSITVRLMAKVSDDAPPNCIVTPQGWNYLVRLYCPRAELFDGTWTMPSPTPISGPKGVGDDPGWAKNTARTVALISARSQLCGEC
jgi:hypothetical protein